MRPLPLLWTPVIQLAHRRLARYRSDKAREDQNSRNTRGRLVPSADKAISAAQNLATDLWEHGNPASNLGFKRGGLENDSRERMGRNAKVTRSIGAVWAYARCWVKLDEGANNY